MTPTEQGEATWPPYEPQVIFYEDRDEFEFVSEDTPTVSRELSPGVTILLRMSDRQPIGFYVAGPLIDAARSPAPQPLKAKMDAYKALLAEAARVLEPFAEEARQIAENNPGWDHDDFQFRIGARPSTLGPYRAARALLTRIKEHNNG